MADSKQGKNQASKPHAADNATVIKPQGARHQGDNNTVVKSDNAPASPVAQDIALTRIRQSLKSQDSSTGFRKAKLAADRALAEDKIILNKRFVLEQTLGAGGMGTVYRARDLRKIEAGDRRPYVAVKVLNEEFKNHPDAFVSLQREASRSHSLSHPNIVTVHDFDRDGGVIFMTMELLEGEPLDIFMRRQGAVDKAQAFPIIAEFCTALSYAHQKGIVHSDLKPGNIFLSQDGTKVLDFGIARVANQTAHDDFDAGTLGALTPAYASLEMIEYADPHPSDDVFAAAIIAYELLTGAHPFKREAADKALEQKLTPIRPQSLNKREWRALEKALQLKRERRTQSIDEFLNDLTHKQKFPLFKFASAFLLLLASGLVYYGFFAADKVSVAARKALEKGQRCFAEADYRCSIESARAVLELVPDSADARGLLAQAERAERQKETDQIVAQANTCLQAGDIDCANTSLELLSGLVSPAKQDVLRAKIVAVQNEQKIFNLRSESENCYAKKDYECAISAANSLLSLDPDDVQAIDMKAKSEREVAIVLAAREARQAQYARSMKQAQRCYRTEDFACAVNAVKRALESRPGDRDAEILQQQARFAQQQHEERMAKAIKLVARAQTCFNEKNYTCAITRSESAMEFVANYRPAMDLRKRAQEEIERLKNSITIE